MDLSGTIMYEILSNKIPLALELCRTNEMRHETNKKCPVASHYRDLEKIKLPWTDVAHFFANKLSSVLDLRYTFTL